MSALVIGVLAGIFAIPKGISETWEAIIGGARLTVAPTSPLKLTYDATTKQLGFRFGVLLHNEGVKAERIRDITAILRADGANRAHRFSLLEIKFKDGDVQIPHNLPIENDNFRAVTCEVQSYLGDDLLKVLRAEETAREFEVLLVGEHDSYEIRFRFDISDELLADLLNPKASNPRTMQFIGSNL